MNEDSEKNENQETGKDGAEQMHCRRCGALMKNGVCPACGYKVYVPIDEKKARKIRWISGGIFLAVLVIALIVKSIKR